jgi:aminoglycoside phosphotransferase (APT) family kinase protein
MDPSTFAGCAAAYLAAAWSSPDLGVSNARRILGGASRHTWSVDTAWLDAAGESHRRALIFRLDPPSSLLESNRGTEYAVYRALYGHPGIPLPEPLLIEDDGGAFGMPFFVMERLDGTAWPHELLTPAFADRREPIVRQMFRILGTIASVDYPAIGLDGVLTPPPADDTWAVELERWERTLHDHDLGPMPITAALIRELRRHPPPPVARIGIVHGDYRIGNVLFTAGGVTGVLDWEMAHLGDPHEDLAWSMARNWRSRASPESIGGVLDPADARAEWETTSGQRVNPESLRWWQLFAHVKASAIWTTAAHEFSTGRTGELMFGTMGWRSVGTQEKWALEDLGVLAP